MKCPVCPTTEVPREARTCPNCGVDLTPVRRLHELADRWFNEALVLSERGEYSQALEKLLGALQLDGEPARIRLLIGKILWRLGRRDEAITYWRWVLEKDPAHPEAKRLLEVAERELPRALLANPSVKYGVYGIILLAFLCLGFLFANYRRTHKYTNAEVEKLQESLEAARRPRGVLSQLAERLKAQGGVRVEGQGDRIAVTFLEGLFLSGSDQLTARSSSRLASVGRSVEQQGCSCQIVVEGIADNMPPKPRGRWADNWTLGFSRARVTAEYMSRQIASSKIKWSATSSGHSNPPFPNDTEANRSKNRTVVLHISLDSERIGP